MPIDLKTHISKGLKIIEQEIEKLDLKPQLAF